jgi:hypothetical protein
MTVTKVSIVLFTAILFLFTSSSIFFSNNQSTFVQAISANESDRVLGDIASLLSSNPDIESLCEEVIRKWNNVGKLQMEYTFGGLP